MIVGSDFPDACGERRALSEFPLDGDTVIDASGHVVSPGFIHLHSHGTNISDYRMQAVQLR